MAWSVSDVPAMYSPPRLGRRRVDRRSRIATPFVAARFQGAARGLWRVWGQPTYRAYLTTGSPPVAGSTPWQSLETLPATPPFAQADGTYYLSISWFNGVLDSGFLPVGPAGETYLVLNISGGVLGLTAPCNPISLSLSLMAGGVVRAVAVAVATSAPAPTQWKLTYTVNGGSSAEIDVAWPGGGIAILDVQLPAQAAGAVVAVTVATQRAATLSVVQLTQTITVASAGPSAPIGGDDYPGPIPNSIEV